MDGVECCKSEEKCENSEDTDKRLPLFGPLSIEDLEDYYREASKRFQELYTKKNFNIVNIMDFSVVTLLGEGAFGKVMLVQNKSKVPELYAMKVIEKRETVKAKRVEHALNEKRVLQSIDFPFGVRLEHFSKDHKCIYFFMPYIQGGEVFTHLRNRGMFDEGTSKFFAAQVVLGLEYLHAMKLIYRDIKPENLLLDCNGYLKITDFGFSKLVLGRTYTFCGTPQYLAPEVIKGHGYGRAIDWWGLGVLIYEMSAGYPPFNGRSNLVLFQSITRGRYIVPIAFNDALRDVISKLLEPDLAKRYGNLKGGSADVKELEWFKPVNWVALFNRKVMSPLVPSCHQASDVSKPTQAFEKTQNVAVTQENYFEEEFKDF